MSARTTRLITLSAAAALSVAVAAAQLSGQSRDRERWSRDRNRDGGDARPQTTQPASTQPQASSSSSSSSSSYSSSSSRHAYGERYGVLEQRNIFVKERSRGGPSRSGPSSPSSQPTRRSAEESLVLRGIAMEDAGYRAYFEDLNTSATVKVSPGDNLARGQVLLIALDAIAFDHDGKQMWIEIGSDLTGKQSSAPSPYASPGAGVAATTGPTSLPFDPNDPNLTTEQKMRLRRFQAEQQQQQRR